MTVVSTIARHCRDAGIRAGDVDDGDRRCSVNGLTLDQAIAKVRGPKERGRADDRAGRQAPFDIRIVRDTVVHRRWRPGPRERLGPLHPALGFSDNAAKTSRTRFEPAWRRASDP